MATTTNFGWETPDDTDLVKDGAAAIRTLGQSIDTSMADLEGGTTGQVLAKNSNTDMDFIWVTSAGDIEGVTAGTGISGGGTSGTVTITNSMATAIDAKGDLVAGTGADAFSRLGVGANNTVLTADSAQATGLKWATPTATADSFTLLGTGTLTGATTITVSGISGINQIFVIIKNASSVNAFAGICLRLNGDTGSNYTFYGSQVNPASSYSYTMWSTNALATQTKYELGWIAVSSATSSLSGVCQIFNANSTGTKLITNMCGATAGTTDGGINYYQGGTYSGTSAISSVSLFSNSGNFDNGTFDVYGSV